jgi:hypothetical protein
MKQMFTAQAKEAQPPRIPSPVNPTGPASVAQGTPKQSEKEVERHYAPQEVELPSSSKNAAMQSISRDGAPKKDPRIRIGRNGKPYIPRRFRNGRTSADIERDNAVEAVLRENAPSTFDPSATEPPKEGEEEWGEGEDADERLAEAFRKEYMAEAEATRKREREREVERQRERERDAKKSGKGGGVEDVLRGPKLGGSRSARMRYIEEHTGKKQ